MFRRFWAVLLTTVVVLLAGCQPSPGLPQFSTADPEFPVTPTLTPFQPVPWTATPGGHPADGILSPQDTPAQIPAATLLPDPEPLGTAPPFSLYIEPYLHAAILPVAGIPADLPLTDNPETASLKIYVGADYPVSQWVYALVVPFPTVTDDISAQDLRAAWQGKSGGVIGGATLWMDESTLGALSAYWGAPAQGAVSIVGDYDNLLHRALSGKTGPESTWAVVPFEQLTPGWKVLAVDGISPVRKDFNLADYKLAVPISMTGAAPTLPQLPASNRDPDKMTVLAMTGVTALVRATAYTMEQRGMTYPATDVGELLRAADITHISNEVPFAEDCPYPNPVQEGVQFCSRTKYIQLLEEVGTDVVELTGDHFADWGAQAMLHTLAMYEQRGWTTYGGGENIKDGRRPEIVTHNGNQLAFVGCNAKGGGFATAGENHPGAVFCDWDWMQEKISALRADGILPIATFQHFEYYTYAAQPNQVRDAERMTSAGAVIVSGSQAHQPQSFQFAHGSFIHHGLGNLFFDQLDVSEPTRQGFIDLHVFYQGRHISTELVTIYFIDYARPRIMTSQERTSLLQAVFSASGW